MASHKKHQDRKKALIEYGEKHINNTLDFNEIMIFINTYKNNRGRLHRKVNTNKQVIHNLLVGMTEFKKIKKGYWKYIPIKKMRNKNE